MRCRACSAKLGVGYEDGDVCSLCARAHAAGYAEAVGDIRRMLEEEATEDDINESMAGAMGFDDSASFHRGKRKAYELALKKLVDGAHVGAAKKGSDK